LKLDRSRDLLELLADDGDEIIKRDDTGQVTSFVDDRDARKSSD
jgi:hypothetical protein